MRIGVLASGFGSNLGALLERGVDVVAVGSDKADAHALTRARERHIPTEVFPRAAYADRAERDAAMAHWLKGHDVELVVLAGYMQLVSPGFLHAFPQRVINVHPALLPAFPGLHAVEQALEYGVKVFGVTVHYVDEGVDTGRIIAQRAVELPDARTPDDVIAAIRPLEHELLGSVAKPSPDSVRIVTQPGEVEIKRALLSVSDKTGLVDFAKGLVELGIEIVSTGGTARALEEAGVTVRSITDFTGFPEIMDGRVKTLHPKLYAGLLARRDDSSHMVAADEQAVEFVDLVCVNLYPFEAVAARRGAADHEIIENIDIGGPTMIRAAAKNFAFSAVVSSPESYDAVLQELRDGHGQLSMNTREHLAAEAFSYTARYDLAIARWFAERHDDFPSLTMSAYEKVLDLSYGENPHQRAAYYAEVGSRMHVLSMVRQLGGKELSFNNVLDLNGARALVDEFEVPACAIIKHNNPCGCAIGANAAEAYERAFACDPMSAFGGVVCLNRPVDKQVAEALVKQFAEIVFAPKFSDEALEVLAAKPKMRILEDNERRRPNIGERDLKRVVGGLLVQDRDIDLEDRSAMEVVTERKPTESEWGEMLFAWKVCKHVRSNAIVVARDLSAVGIGAGQMSRVDSVHLAIEKSQVELAGAALASDAYFPFADGPQLAIDAGVTCIIQPGGSIRDPEVVEAADAAGISMVFTHRRHFKH